MAKGIIFFDMDGTLTNENSCITLGKSIGKENEVEKLERLVERGMSDAEWVRKMGEIVAEHPRAKYLENFRSIYDKIKFIDGIEETLDILKSRDYMCGVVTSGIGEFARLMTFSPYKFNFGYGCSTRADYSGTIVKGFGPPVVTPEGKGRFVKRKCKETGIDWRDRTAVGDSEGDRPMFNAVGKSIAINSENSLGAKYHIKKCRDLRLVLSYIFR